MHIGVLAEQAPREQRVALTPPGVASLVDSGHDVSVESGAGAQAGIVDDEYAQAGVAVATRADVAAADVVLTVVGGAADVVEVARSGQLHIALFDPLWDPASVEALAATGADVMALELVPRITKAQSMDVLSSMATITGYEAVLLAARRLPRMFPLMMTAAGTIPPAKVLVLGAGVAGLQAIATARRLGAVVEAYDVRPAAAEQIKSLGARAIVLDLDTVDSEDVGGYAKAQDDDQNRRQQELLSPHLGASDILITTAAIPGRRSPMLVTPVMVEGMSVGSVVVDLAAERGGNCELTVADQEIVHAGITILGPTDMASWSAATASSMLSTNIVNLLDHLVGEGDLSLDRDDEIVGAMLVASGGQIVHAEVQGALESTRRSA
jgi:NAD(P) transhydrogenase subunit alpha